MAPLSNQQFKAFVGLDWADTKHDICLQQAGDDRREADCIPHQVTRIDEWAKALHQRFGGPIAVALELELATGPIVSVLQKHAFVTLFAISPAMLAKYRVAFKPSRARDDLRLPRKNGHLFLSRRRCRKWADIGCHTRRSSGRIWWSW
jgi:hypothetical protein